MRITKHDTTQDDTKGTKGEELIEISACQFIPIFFGSSVYLSVHVFRFHPCSQGQSKPRLNDKQTQTRLHDKQTQTCMSRTHVNAACAILLSVCYPCVGLCVILSVPCLVCVLSLPCFLRFVLALLAVLRCKPRLRFVSSLTCLVQETYGQHGTRQDRQDNIRQDKTRQDNIRQDNTGSNETTQEDKTIRHKKK